MQSSRPQKLGELALLFLRLGFTSFGGPAAHIALMHHEVVERRRWLNDQEFLDLLGATNLIPGPNSTEMAIHIGYMQAGWPGLIVAGICFIVPAMVIVLGLAWAYVRFGSLPQAQQLLYGIKPVVIALIAQAIWNLGRKATKSVFLGVCGVVILVLYFVIRLNEVLLLLGGGLIIMMLENRRTLWKATLPKASLPVWIAAAAPAAIVTAFSMPRLFLTFLKIGATLYGSGYVLLAFLRSDFVQRLGWLTDQQLLDAIAVGQVTPGPLFTTATFIGYLLGGIPGGLVATLGIFLPSFIFVAMLNPLIPRLRSSPWTGSFLDGINVASLGLMTAVTIQLGQSSLVDWFTAAIAAISLLLLLRFKLNSTWLIAGGALAGLAMGLVK
ncbi:MAG TPA: chromate transporter [Anaerolineales bacterium]|nr:chromate transporter [Anaerolineales bacterium]